LGYFENDMKSTPTIALARQIPIPAQNAPFVGNVTRGSLFMGASIVFFASHALLIKVLYVSHGVSPWQTLWFRFSVGCVVTAAVFLPRGELKPWRVWNRRLLILRGIFGVVGTALYYYTIPLVGAGIATLLGCSYVVFSILLAAWLLREKLTLARGIWVGITFVGLATLTYSPESSHGPATVWTYVFAFAGGLCAACVIVTIRKLHRTEATPTIFWAQCAWGLLLTTPILAFVWVTPNLVGWSLLLLCGLLSALGQLFMTAGFRHLPVAIGSGFQMGLPVLATLGGVAFLGEQLGFLQWIAAAVVVIGTWRTVSIRN
jgi:drug/metabolite transporter (DMT)-like permease